MQYTIIHEIPGRIRARLIGYVPDADVDPLIAVISACPEVTKVVVYPNAASVSVTYVRTEGAREAVLSALDAVNEEAIDQARTEYHVSLAPRTNKLLFDLAWLVGSHFLRKWFLPAPLRTAWTVWSYRHFLFAGIRSLLRGKLDVPVLDAAAIAMSFIKGDPKTAASTMLLLCVGETLEEYTRARSENELIYSLLAMPESAQRIEGDQEISVPATELAEGDLVVIRTGMPISIDGGVVRGVAMVNQAALTGESLAVERSEGDDVFAGTAVEDGEIFVRVTGTTGKTKLRSIVSLVELSESMKGQTQARREALADKIVPWNFLLAGIVALTTRSLIKTSAALMVDYSCALKLTSSIAVLTAMSQSAKAGFTVKGSKYFEAMAKADTIVFDKTGTLTDATPVVAKVIAFDGWNKTQVLRFAACLEEHFPHPVARAVVREAAERNLKHRERHAEVEYLVAHGIASSLDGKRAIIGSAHFVFEDEGVKLTPEDRETIDTEFDGLSPLFLAVDGELVGAIGVHDPLKTGVREAVEELRELGFEHIVMLTGDNEHTAAAIAKEAGIDEYQAEMLPEDKHAYVARLREEGHTVVMVGDGVNDSPALSASDVGIAMAAGTAIATEVGELLRTHRDLHAISQLRRMSTELMRRLDSSFRYTMGINSLLLALGIGGVITPQTSSLLHNGTTVALSLASTKEYVI